MNKPLNSNFVAGVFLVTTVLILALLPIRIQIVPNEVAAQETPAAPEAEGVKVAQAETANVVEFTLRTVIGGTPAMAFVGVGGDIDGVVNPELVVNLGDTVRLTVVNGDPILHDLMLDEFGVSTGEMLEDEQTVVLEFVADKPGTFEYYCSVPGHREIGMKGTFKVVGAVTVGDPGALDEARTDDGYGTADAGHDMGTMTAVETKPAVEDAVSIVHNPADVPAPVGDRGPETLRVDLTAKEVDGVLADGTTYRYMTFNGTVPGPMLRMRVGDTMEVYVHNEMTSTLPHSIDLHAVTGPGGGAVFTQTLAGEEKMFTFKALQPGLYVYHCATASIGHHISSGMYGLILVEPAGGLPEVDREFYVMQGEIYTAQDYGTKGHLDFSYDKMLDEHAEYFVFNGSAGALTQDEYALRANVGETVRIFFGVGGPNAISSFHVIGEIFDRVYDEGSLTSDPLTDVQTTLVPPGGSTMVEFKVDVPGNYILVDHALSRLERGLAGYLIVEGEDDPTIFSGEGAPEASGH
jgi:nitrite reductase (NO-forming)